MLLLGVFRVHPCTTGMCPNLFKKKNCVPGPPWDPTSPWMWSNVCRGGKLQFAPENWVTGSLSWRSQSSTIHFQWLNFWGQIAVCHLGRHCSTFKGLWGLMAGQERNFFSSKRFGHIPVAHLVVPGWTLNTPIDTIDPNDVDKRASSTIYESNNS
jgi:hypothetical protein